MPLQVKCIKCSRKTKLVKKCAHFHNVLLSCVKLQLVYTTFCQNFRRICKAAKSCNKRQGNQPPIQSCGKLQHSPCKLCATLMPTFENPDVTRQPCNFVNFRQCWIKLVGTLLAPFGWTFSLVTRALYWVLSSPRCLTQHRVPEIGQVCTACNQNHSPDFDSE